MEHNNGQVRKFAMISFLVLIQSCLMAMNGNTVRLGSLNTLSTHHFTNPERSKDSSELMLTEIDLKMKFKFKSIQLFKVDFKEGLNESRANTLFPKGTVLSFELKDMGSNPCMIYYQLDNAPEQIYLDHLRLVAKGQHSVRIRTIDSFGREFLSEPIKFRIAE